MSHPVIESTPSPLARAMEENLLEHVSFLQERRPDMTVERRDDLVVVDAGLPSDTFNKVLAARLSEDIADASINEVLTDVRRRGRPFVWWIGPCSRPLDLEERLRRRGLREQERELGMTIELDKVPEHVPLPAGTTIRQVTTAEHLTDFAGVLARLSDPPDENLLRFFEKTSDLLLEPGCPLRFFVAYVGDCPAAVSELCLGGGVAGVHMVGTDPAYRRRGLEMALTWKVLDEGRQLGLATGVLQASAEGQPVYERLGFEPCGRFAEYAID